MNPWHPNAFVESIFVNRVLFDSLTKPGQGPQSRAGPGHQLGGRRGRAELDLQPAAPTRSGATARRSPLTMCLFTFNDIVLKKELGATGAGNFSAVQNVEAVNPTTVKFNLSRPFSALPSYLAYNAGILPKHAFDGQADPWAFNAFNKGMPVSQRALQSRVVHVGPERGPGAQRRLLRWQTQPGQDSSSRSFRTPTRRSPKRSAAS